MGSHHKGPSIVKNIKETTDLSKALQNNPSLVGEKILKRFGISSLPYLFKVLSINKVLAIQAHPDKELAEFLHKTKPEIYQDNNHKPEIAIGSLSPVLYLFMVFSVFMGPRSNVGLEFRDRSSGARSRMTALCKLSYVA